MQQFRWRGLSCAAGLSVGGLLIFIAGCPGPEPSWSEGAGGQGGSPGAGGGGASSSSGAAGGSQRDSGKSVVGVVGGGGHIKSPTYEMVIMVGQPTQNQGKTTSPGYNLQGGLAASNGNSK
jgi:hypothetical protein